MAWNPHTTGCGDCSHFARSSCCTPAASASGILCATYLSRAKAEAGRLRAVRTKLGLSVDLIGFGGLAGKSWGWWNRATGSRGQYARRAVKGDERIGGRIKRQAPGCAPPRARECRSDPGTARRCAVTASQQAAGAAPPLRPDKASRPALRVALAQCRGRTRAPAPRRGRGGMAAGVELWWRAGLGHRLVQRLATEACAACNPPTQTATSAIAPLKICVQAAQQHQRCQQPATRPSAQPAAPAMRLCCSACWRRRRQEAAQRLRQRWQRWQRQRWQRQRWQPAKAASCPCTWQHKAGMRRRMPGQRVPPPWKLCVHCFLDCICGERACAGEA